MAWSDNLLACKYRGVLIHVVATDDNWDRATARYSYPYKNGGEIEDLGDQPRSVSLQIVVFGKNYERDLDALMQVLAQPGSGELIHPIFGTMQCQVAESRKIHHEAESPDFARIDVLLVESDKTPALFSAPALAIVTDALVQTADNLDNAMESILVNAVANSNESITEVAEQIDAESDKIINNIKKMPDSGNYIAEGLAELPIGIAAAQNCNLWIANIRNLNALYSRFKSLSNLLNYLLEQPKKSRNLVGSALSIYGAISTARARAAAEILAAALRGDTVMPNETELNRWLEHERREMSAVLEYARTMPHGYPRASLTNSVIANTETMSALTNAVRTRLAQVRTGITRHAAPWRVQAHWFTGNHDNAYALCQLNSQICNANWIAVGDAVKYYGA